MRLKDWQGSIHINARNHGWWDPPPPEDWWDALLRRLGVRRPAPPNIPEKLALIHSEISEALEAYRRGEMSARVTSSGKPDGFPVELADAVIRILDLCGHLGIDMERMIRMKHVYNINRPYRHGGKRA